MGTETQTASETTRSGTPRVWMVAFGLALVGLIVSVVLLLDREHLPARFIDVEASRLEAVGDEDAVLRLVLRHASSVGPLAYDVAEPTEASPLWTITVRNAVKDPQEIDRDDAVSDGDASRRVLEIRVPRVERVRVLDARWGRVESVVIERRDAGSPRS